MSLQTPQSPERSVILTDIDVPFGRLVLFFIKAGLAAIPAAIVVWLIAWVAMMAVAALFGLGPWWRGGWMMMH